jgi:hypothetical protein
MLRRHRRNQRDRARGPGHGPRGRELSDLLWYQGLTQAEAAAIVGIT